MNHYLFQIELYTANRINRSVHAQTYAEALQLVYSDSRIVGALLTRVVNSFGECFNRPSELYNPLIYDLKGDSK